MNDYQAVISTPFGALGIRTNDHAVTAVDFLNAGMVPKKPESPVAVRACEELNAYLKDAEHVIDVPLDIRGTPFQHRVWQAIAAIPATSPLTYGELARRLGSSPRAVGQACGSNPVPLIIPCHRVLAKSGPGGFMHSLDAGSLNIKHWLLAHESGK